MRPGEPVLPRRALPAPHPCILSLLVACVQAKDPLIQSVEFAVPGFNVPGRAGKRVAGEGQVAHILIQLKAASAPELSGEHSFKHNPETVSRWRGFRIGVDGA